MVLFQRGNRVFSKRILYYKVLFLYHFSLDHGKIYSKRKENDRMYTYKVYNKTRETYCTITSEDFLEVGQEVLVRFDNEELEGLHECEVIERLDGIES